MEGRTDYARIAQACERAANDTPPKPAVYFALGVSYFELQRYAEAVEALSTAILLGLTNDYRTYDYRRRAREGLGQFVTAYDDYRSEQRLNPAQKPRLPSGYVEAFIEKGRAEPNTEDGTRKAIDDFSVAIELAGTADRKLVAYNWRRLAHDKLKNIDAAISDYEQMQRLDAERTKREVGAADVTRYADVFMTRGQDALNKSDFQRAINLYTRAIAVKPDYALAYYWRAQSESSASQSDDALRDLGRAIALDDRYAPSYRLRGEIWRSRDDKDRAIADFNKAVDLDPNDLSTYKLLRSTYEANDNFVGALRAYTQIVKRDPKYADADPLSGKYPDKYAEALYWRGLGLKRQGVDLYRRSLEATSQTFDQSGPCYERAVSKRSAMDIKGVAAACLDLALGDYDESLKLKKDSVGPLNARCWLRAIVGDKERQWNEALNDCVTAEKRILDLGGQNGSVHISILDSRGFVYLKMGRNDSAIADYTRVIRGLPNPSSEGGEKTTKSQSLYGRGVARKRNGDTSDGQADINLAISIDPLVAGLFKLYGIVAPVTD